MYINKKKVIFSQPEQVVFGQSLTTLQSFHISYNAASDNFLLDYLCLVNAMSVKCCVLSLSYSFCGSVFDTKPEKHPSKTKFQCSLLKYTN